MKVVYDYRIFLKQRHGGISRYFMELAKHIGVSGESEARILAPLFVNHYLRENREVSSCGIYLAKSPAFAQPYLEAANSFFSRASLGFRPPDILHETYYGRSSLAGPGTRLVTTVYDMIHEKFPLLYPGDETPELKALAVKRADHIFCISKKTQEDLVEILGVEKSRTSITHLGCDFQLRKADFRQRPQSFPYLLFVGPRGKHKNFRVLVEAYAASVRLRGDFKVVCFGSTEFQADEISLMQSLGVDPDRFLHVTGEDDLLPTYYAHASVFVYPSLYEGFGFPPLEAMSLGCPTVCSDAGSIPEILGDATEYFSSGKAESLRAALEKVAYLSEGDRRVRSNAGIERVDRYTWEKCSKETLTAYKKIASG